MAGPERLQQGDQAVAVIPRGRHQVAAAHVEPFDPVEIRSEMRLDGLQRLLQMLRARFAEDVEMQPLDTRRKSAVRRQLFGRDAQPRAGDAGVVEVRLDGRILRVDPQAAGNAVDKGFLAEAAELRQRIERDMIAAIEDFVDIGVRVDRGVGVGGTPELLENETRLGGGTCSRTVGMLRQLGKNAPHGAGLQGDDNFGARFPAHTVDSRQVPVQQLLVEDVAR